ncbi:hypothetical protein BASA81_002949 [Batrachochytrium salamandrivorans]|nr:hypothetical protein BASA81_002949 [Batrachochytrium salamandrivorans]
MKLTLEQAIELNKLAAGSQSAEKTQYWTSQAAFAAVSLLLGLSLAIMIELQFGTAWGEEDEERDYTKALALAVSLSSGIFLTLSKRFEQVAQIVASTVPTPPKEEVENKSTSVSLTPKQLRLIGRTEQDVGSHPKQVQGILSPTIATPSQQPKRSAQDSTPAPPSTPLFRQASTLYSSATTTPATPIRPIVLQNEAKYSSPQSPLTVLPAKNISVATPLAKSAPTPTQPQTVLPPVADEAAAFALVEELEKTKEFNMDACVSKLRLALSEHIKTQVLDKLQDVNDKLSSIRTGGIGQWYPLRVLEWEELADVREMHAFQKEGLSLADRQELKRLLYQHTLLGRYCEVKRQGNSTPFSRNYVWKRLRALVKSGSELNAYSWCGGSGGGVATTAWDSHSTPTDAEILFRVACVWFDQCLKRGVAMDMYDEPPMLTEANSFSVVHVKDESEVALLQQSDWWGFVACGRYQVASSSFSRAVGFIESDQSLLSAVPLAEASSSSRSVFHPHWKVRTNGQVWEISQGRSNLFHALVIFLYSLRATQVAEQLQDIANQVFPQSSSSLMQ